MKLKINKPVVAEESYFHYVLTDIFKFEHIGNDPTPLYRRWAKVPNTHHYVHIDKNRMRVHLDTPEFSKILFNGEVANHTIITILDAVIPESEDKKVDFDSLQKSNLIIHGVPYYYEIYDTGFTITNLYTKIENTMFLANPDLKFVTKMLLEYVATIPPTIDRNHYWYNYKNDK